VKNVGTEPVGAQKPDKRFDWHDEECARDIQIRNEAREKTLQRRITRAIIEKF
jgi:hypothetical protein